MNAPRGRAYCPIHEIRFFGRSGGGPQPRRPHRVTRKRRARAPQRGVVHTFAGGALDRAAHVRGDTRRIGELLGAASTRFLPFRDMDPLVVDGAVPSLAWLERRDVSIVADVESAAVFLGLDDGEARFAVAVDGSVAGGYLTRAGSRFRGVRELAPFLSAADASVAALGRSLTAWHATHGHCSRCGSRTLLAEAGHARRCVGEGCGSVQFPRTDPVVIMLVHREDRCLLGRAVRTPGYPPGLHSCLAGYVEPGESIEEAVRRETWEEAGLEVDRVRYHSSQPWPFPSTLMIGCFAEALPGEIHIDPVELESARWFDRVELGHAVERWDDEAELRVPPPLTIAHQLARAWLEDPAGASHPHTED